jgi:peptidoglycan hydrolase CwlO-like protein
MSTDGIIKVLLGAISSLTVVVAALWRRDVTSNDKKNEQCEKRVTALEADVKSLRAELGTLQGRRVDEAKEMLNEALKVIARNNDRLEDHERAVNLMRTAMEAAVDRLSRP